MRILVFLIFFYGHANCQNTDYTYNHPLDIFSDNNREEGSHYINLTLKIIESKGEEFYKKKSDALGHIRSLPDSSPIVKRLKQGMYPYSIPNLVDCIITFGSEDKYIEKISMLSKKNRKESIKYLTFSIWTNELIIKTLVREFDYSIGSRYFYSNMNEDGYFPRLLALSKIILIVKSQLDHLKKIDRKQFAEYSHVSNIIKLSNKYGRMEQAFGDPSVNYANIKHAEELIKKQRQEFIADSLSKIVEDRIDSLLESGQIRPGSRVIVEGLTPDSNIPVKLDDFQTFKDLVTSEYFFYDYPDILANIDIDKFYSKRKKIKQIEEFEEGWVTTFDYCKVQMIGLRSHDSDGYEFVGKCDSGLANGFGKVYVFRGNNYRPVSFKKNRFCEATFKDGIPVSNFYVVDNERITVVNRTPNPNVVVRIVLTFNSEYIESYSREHAEMMAKYLTRTLNFESDLLKMRNYWIENNLGIYLKDINISECKSKPKVYWHLNRLGFEAHGNYIFISENTKPDINISQYENGRKNGIAKVLKGDEIVSRLWRNGEEAEIVSIENIDGEIMGDRCESGDCINDVGKLIFSNGDIYEGEFKNGEFNGDGHFKSLSYDFDYNGYFKKNEFNGYGTLKSKGTKFVGEFKNGVPHGKCSVYEHVAASFSGFAAWVRIFDGEFENGELKQLSDRSEKELKHLGELNSDLFILVIEKLRNRN